MKPETRFYTHTIKPALSACHVQRIEATTGRGIPDLNVCFHGVEFWIELKVAVRNKIYLRTQQKAWGHKRSDHGGHVFLVAKYPLETCVWKFPGVDGYYVPKYCIVTSTPRIKIPNKDVKSRLLIELCSLLED